MTPPAPAELWRAVVTRGSQAALIDERGTVTSGSVAHIRAHAVELEGAQRCRWVWESAGAAAALIGAGTAPLARTWDLTEAHRLLHGGYEVSLGQIWAAARGIPQEAVRTRSRGDLFDYSASADLDPASALTDDGHLRGDLETWLDDGEHLGALGQLLLDCAHAQVAGLRRVGARALMTAYAESAASMLCVELESAGLPIDRSELERLISQFAGPRSVGESAARRSRDRVVLALAPGSERTDLRNPEQVKAMLAGVGVQVPSTRKWVLEDYRAVHPVVGALLDWRAAERIATTYGFRWLDQHVGVDDRLRGRWSACDGAAGRMTASAGLHNLPAVLRPAVAPLPGRVLVRADLGQVEPRVLAVVSGDQALAAAARADDLYAPVATRLGVDRAQAKVAVLSAMYGGRAGSASEALTGLKSEYPAAMRFLDQAYAAGVRAETLRTWGGRLVRTGRPGVDPVVGADPARDAARGRYARNAVVQGAAAELFKMWAATVRASIYPLGARLVLCLHDELLVEAPVAQASEVQEALAQGLAEAARRWSGAAQVRFLAESSIIERWA